MGTAISVMRDVRFGQQARRAKRGGVNGGVCSADRYREVRDIVLGGFARSPHRHDPRGSPRAVPASQEGPLSGFLSAVLRQRCCPRSWRVGQRIGQSHAALVMPVVATAVIPVRASPSRACGQP
jgi:hypothetical protein